MISCSISSWVKGHWLAGGTDVFLPKRLFFPASLAAGFPVTTFQPMVCTEKTVWFLSNLLNRESVHPSPIPSLCCPDHLCDGWSSSSSSGPSCSLSAESYEPASLGVKPSAIPVYTRALWGLFGNAANPYWRRLPVGVACGHPGAISMLAHMVHFERKSERPPSQVCNMTQLSIGGFGGWLPLFSTA